MRRRDFIKFILGSAAAWPLPLRAQQAAKVYRIGYLGVTSHAGYTREIEALLKGLRQLGYEEGKNIAIHYEFAEGDYNRLPVLAAKLVNLNVDVLIAHSTPGARAAKQATSTIPIVVAAAGRSRRRRARDQHRPPRRESDRVDLFLCRDLRKTGRADQGSCSGGNTAGRSRESRQPQRQGSSYGHAAYSSLVASGTSDGGRESSGRHCRCVCDAGLARGSGAHFY